MNKIIESDKNMIDSIKVDVIVKAEIQKVWECWTDPKHLVNWNNASDEWHTPLAENDPRTGGRLKLRMEKKDGSDGFDHEAVYDHVIQNEKIEYTTSDGRHSTILFDKVKDGVNVIEIFEPEHQTPIELQKEFVQSILDRFKEYVEQLN